MIRRMNSQLCRSTVLVLAALATPLSAQTTWYVDASAAPPGVGSAISPYASIQYAIDRLTTVNGDTLLVAPGTYVENVHFGVKRLRLESAAGPLVTQIRAATNGAVVSDEFVSLLATNELIGFTIAGTPGLDTTGVRADNMIVRRCIVRGHDHTFSKAGLETQVLMWVEQCTVVGNSNGARPGAFAGELFINSSILYGNPYGDLENNVDQIHAHHSLWNYANTHAAIGVGNLDLAPQFWDAGSLDFHLLPGSPCIDAGDPSLPLDPDGSRADIGALTYSASYAPAPTVYCTSKTSSLGCVPSIGASGSASASGAPFTITCVDTISHRLGLLFYGFAPQGAAYQGGYLCVQSPVFRTPVIDAGGTPGIDDCSGIYSYDFDALIQSGANLGLTAGEIVYAQFWARDPGIAFATVRSDALRFGIAP